MSNEPRHGAGGLILAAAAAAAIALLAPVVSAQSSSATLTLSVADAAPEETILATLFVAGSVVPVDVSVQDHVACELAGAVTEAPCDWYGDPFSLRIVDGGTEYMLYFLAPSTPGPYDITLTRRPFVDSDAGSASASATFTVTVPQNGTDVPLDAAGDPTVPPAGPGEDTTAPALGDGSATRWFVSSTAGTATLVALVAARRNIGGKP